MGQLVGEALCLLLGCGPHSSCLAARGDAHRHARPRTGKHAKDVGIKIVGVQHVNPKASQVTYEASQLFAGLEIVKAVQWKGGNLAQIQAYDVIS